MKWIWEKDGVAREATSETERREWTQGYRGSKPARESGRLLEEVLIEAEGITAHIRKIRCVSGLV